MSRRFGIEFELRDNLPNGYLSLVTALESVGVSFANLCANDVYEPIQSSGYQWDIKYDCSCGYEVCTPAMQTEEDWQEIRRVLKALYAAGARTDRSCATHVHVEIKDFTAAQLRLLGQLWITFESVIFWTLARSRTNNNYCAPLNYHSTGFQSNMQEGAFRRFVNGLGRYLALNMSTWWYNGRVEFRAHHGTLRYRDIRAWVDFLMVLVESVPKFTSEDYDNLSALKHVSDLERYTALQEFVRKFGGSEELVEKLTEFVQRRQPAQLPA